MPRALKGRRARPSRLDYLVSQRDGVIGPGHDRVVVRRVGRDHHGHAILRVHVVGVNVVGKLL